MGLREGMFLIQKSEPVGPFTEVCKIAGFHPPRAVTDDRTQAAGVSPQPVFGEPVRREGHHHIHIRGRTVVVIGEAQIEMLRPSVAIRDILRPHHRLGNREVVGIRDVYLIFGGILGRDEHDAVRRTRSVNSRGCSILEDRYRCDVVRIKIGRVAFDTVDEDQGAAALSDGCRSADVIVGSRDWLAVLERYVEVGNSAFEHLGDVGVRPGGEHFAPDLLHGSGKVYLSLRAVTDHNGLVKGEGFLLQRNIQNSQAAGIQSLGDEAEAGELQHLVACHMDGILAVEVRTRGGRGAGNGNNHSGKRRAACIHDRS